ncbi:hypothetical protein SVA_2459 [Sulfurifustis variabilis]|uniref:histidine kinase n=1 Tax=Sulfurifustis variabilis TaxID=1675686 RepID=A0A1B4VED4_9GAMM|nr:PAS domain-containing protein [Sulfurifustis variabilis]BAU49007.1 hypothetical protein SVA_2459 [Sulfurifustis variabilis]
MKRHSHPSKALGKTGRASGASKGPARPTHASHGGTETTTDPMGSALEKLEAAQTRLAARNQALLAERRRLLEERRHDETAKRSNEELLRLLADNLPAAVSYVDSAERYRFNNRVYEEWFGCSPGDIYGKTVADVIGQEAYDTVVREPLRRALAGERVSYERRVPYLHGGPRFVDAVYVPHRDEHGRVLGVFVRLRDISEQRAAREAVEQANRLLDGVVNNTHLLMACLDTDFRFLWVNRAYAEADGRDPADFAGKNHFALYPDADNERVFREVVETGTPRFFHAKPFEYRNNPERGVGFWDWALIPVKHPGGRVERLVLTLLDVTARVQAEQDLRSERNFGSAILDTVGALIVVLDRDGRIARFNHQCELTTGYTLEEVRGRRLADFLILPEESATVNEVFTRLAAGQFPNQHENYWITRDGRRRWIHWANTALLGEGGEVEFVIATGLDMTELREASERARSREQELAHAARAGMISELASGLAHEVNQPLTAIASYAQECVRRLRAGEADDGTLLGAVEQMATQAQRASDIIRTMREFVSKRTTTPARIDINTIVSQAATLAASEARRAGIVLRLELAPAMPALWADAIQIEQVVLNLLRNGIDALQAAPPGRRSLAVRTVVNGGRDVEVAVIDTGPGLRIDQLPRLFERFYTTKKEGMGMGLALSRSIIDGHRGRLWAENNPGGGATFRFTLPIEPQTDG